MYPNGQTTLFKPLGLGGTSFLVSICIICMETNQTFLFPKVSGMDAETFLRGSVLDLRTQAEGRQANDDAN